MPEFFPFFVILLIAVIFSRMFSKLRIPWVVSLIIGGIVAGPNGFGWFAPDNTIDFLATIGLVLLMFMAGMESRLSNLKDIKKNIAVVGVFIGLLPAFAGIVLVLSLGYELASAALIGIIFMSSAVAMLIPQLQAKHIISSKLGKTIIGSTILVDAISLLLLSVFLQLATGDGPSGASLLIYPFAIALLGSFAWALPRLRWLALPKIPKDAPDLFERELRFMILILIGLVVFFEFIGLHAIVAGFFGGMILSRSTDSTLLNAKLHAISYGFFVPVFFVVVGASTDPAVFIADTKATITTLAVILGLIASKFFGGWLGGKLSGFDSTSSALVGAAAIPQLSTSLAVAFLGFGEGILDQELLSAVVGLVIVTSIVAPVLVNSLAQKLPGAPYTATSDDVVKDMPSSEVHG